MITYKGKTFCFYTKEYYEMIKEMAELERMNQAQIALDLDLHQPKTDTETCNAQNQPIVESDTVTISRDEYESLKQKAKPEIEKVSDAEKEIVRYLRKWGCIGSNSKCLGYTINITKDDSILDAQKAL